MYNVYYLSTFKCACTYYIFNYKLTLIPTYRNVLYLEDQTRTWADAKPTLMFRDSNMNKIKEI